MTIATGKDAPAFTLKDQTENPLSLSDLQGQYVIVYFYPKDDTPGCTKEACGFRDHIAAFDNLNAVVLGVSPDEASSHARFIDKFNLPFKLLSDPDKKMMQAYGAWGEKVMYGKTRIGVIRSTVLVDPQGKVRGHWRKVPNAADHPAKVLAFLQQIST